MFIIHFTQQLRSVYSSGQGSKNIKKVMRTTRKGSLDQITHKNKDQILFYVANAKVQIYSHCLICYDASTFMGLSPASHLNQLYGVCSSPKNKGIEKAYQCKMKNLQNDAVTQQAQQKTSKVNNSHDKQTKQTIKAQGSKIIYFNNPDIAFFIQQQKNTIQIHNLASKTLEITFQVENGEVMHTVQSLLRKKLCELGFYKKYKILKVLGKGGTAVVHLVERLSDRRYFAAKIISTQSSNQKQFQLFVNEAKLLRMLKHPNIIHLESIYIHKTELVQVLEYLPGGTLLQSLKNHQIRDSESKWAVLKDITCGLDYLRQRRIVHRDLKLENLMIRKSSNTREVVISDFGLACWAGETNPIYDKCGTPGYIAPEVLSLPAKVILIDHRSDIFSLGVIAHLLFLHEPLFHYKGSLKQLIQDNKRANYDLKQRRYLELPSNELNFLMLTLCKNLNTRATADQLLNMLNTKVTSSKVSKKNPLKERKLSLEPEIQVQVKRQTSMRRKTINIDLESAKRAKSELKNEPQTSSPTRKMLADNARKFVSNFWDAISPSSRRQGLKLKPNSVEKHRKLSDFLNE